MKVLELVVGDVEEVNQIWHKFNKILHKLNRFG